MKSKNAALRKVLAFAGALVCGMPLAAAAYVGPGAGLSALGSLLALIAAVLVAIAGFVWYPVKRLLRRRNSPVAQAGADPTPAQPRTDALQDDQRR